MANAEWGQSVVQQLAECLQKNETEEAFYGACSDYQKLSPLVRELSWINNQIPIAPAH